MGFQTAAVHYLSQPLGNTSEFSVWILFHNGHQKEHFIFDKTMDRFSVAMI